MSDFRAALSRDSRDPVIDHLVEPQVAIGKKGAAFLVGSEIRDLKKAPAAIFRQPPFDKFVGDFMRGG